MRFLCGLCSFAGNNFFIIQISTLAHCVSDFTIQRLTLNLMKILVVKLGAIGDIVHTLPTLAAIRRELPQAEISWAVEKRSAEILRGNELIDNLIEVDTRSIRGKLATAI